MSENITTINAGGGIMVDVVETPKKKPARTEAQKQARREREATKRKKDDAILAELTPEQINALNAAKVPEVDVEVVEETTIEEQLVDGTIVYNGPSTITAPTIDFATLGMSVALADLADARGMNVSDVITLPELLKGAGLPAEPHGAVVARAAKMQRDSTDAMLWRNNPTARSLAVRLVNGESPTEILAVETRKTATAEPKRIAAAVELDSTPAAAPVATKREPKPQIKRNSAFGHAGVAIVRWLGKHDYSLSDAVAALSRVGITHLSEGTIKVNLCGGKAGRYGGAPELTQEQINQLLGK